MSEQLPTGDNAVYVFLEMIALALVFGCIDALVAGRPWYVWTSCLLIGFMFFLAGIKWPWMKSKTGTHFSSLVERIANNQRYRYGFGLILVGFIGGYTIIYLHALRSDLDTYVMPRTISEQQARSLRNYLSHREAHAVTVKVDSTDEEALEYAGELFNTLRETDWNVTIDGASGDPNTKNAGLCIGVVEQSAAPQDPRHDPEMVLQAALNSADIFVNCSRGSGYSGSSKLFLWVGRRPRKLGDQESILSRIGRWLEQLGGD